MAVRGRRTAAGEGKLGTAVGVTEKGIKRGQGAPVRRGKGLLGMIAPLHVVEKVCAFAVPPNWAHREAAVGSDKHFWLARKGRAVKGTRGRVIAVQWFTLREENDPDLFQLERDDEEDVKRLLTEDVQVLVVGGGFRLKIPSNKERLAEAAKDYYWEAEERARKVKLSNNEVALCGQWEKEVGNDEDKDCKLEGVAVRNVCECFFHVACLEEENVDVERFPRSRIRVVVQGMHRSAGGDG